MTTTRQKWQLIALIIVAGVALAAIVLLSFQSVTVAPFSPLSAPITPQAYTATVAPTNLLRNPNLEKPYVNGGRAEWWVAHHWNAFAQESPPCIPLTPGCDLPCPENCLKYTGDAGAVVSKTTGLLRIVPVTLSVWHTSTLLFYSQSVTPLGSIEMNVHLNPAVVTVTNGVTVDGGQVRLYPGYIRFSKEISFTTVGRNELFSVDVTPHTTETLRFEVSYFAGTPSGGWYYGPYENYAVSRITQTVLIKEISVKKCVSDTGCYWAVPEFTEAIHAQRVYTGNSSQSWFSYGRMSTGGISQTFAVTKPGWYRASAFVQGWQCFDWLTCCSAGWCTSDAPYQINFEICLNDKCSPPSQVFDDWGKIYIDDFITGTATVSIQSSPRFDWARNNNDSYVGQVGVRRLSNLIFIPILQK